MDEFDSKIIRMRQDIDLIKNEIHGIQKKTKESKGNFKKSINSLSSLQHQSHLHPRIHTHYQPNQLRKTAPPPESSYESIQSPISPTEKVFQEIIDIFNIRNTGMSLDNVLKEIKLNKQKEDLANLINQQFSHDKKDLKKSFAYVTMFMNKTRENEDRYQEEILLYQSICQELMRKNNQKKVDQNKIKGFLKKIYMVENEIKKYQDVNVRNTGNGK